MPPNTTAQITIIANASRLPNGLQRAMGMLGSFAASAKQLLSRINLAPSSIMKSQRWAQHAVGQTVGNLATRGIDTLIDQGKEVFDFNDKLVRFGIAAKIGGQALDNIGRIARQTAEDTGVNATAVLDTARAYADLAGAANFTADKMKILAKTGQATGAAGGDLAQLMYQLTTNMKVPAADLENTIGGLVEQSKDGAVEAKQMAREFGAIIPLWAKFGVTGRAGANELGAMFQVIRDGYNTADEAGTGMQRILAGLRSNAPRFEAHGVKIFNVDKDGVKTARHFVDIFRDIQKSDLVKDPSLMKKAFGRTEGWRGIEMLLLPESITRADALRKAGEKNGVIMQDMRTYAESAAGRMAIAFEKMKNAVAAAFTPERIEKFVAAIEDAVDKIGPLVEMVGKLGDVVGGIYGAGKSIREFFTPDDSRAFAAKPSEVQDYAKRHGMSERAALLEMQDDYGKAYKFRQDIKALTPGDKTTAKSDELAVQALLSSPSGSELGNAAFQYITATGISPQRQAEIMARVNRQNVDDAIARGQGRSVAASGPVTATPEQFTAIADALNKVAVSDALGASRSEAAQKAQIDYMISQIPNYTTSFSDMGKAIADAISSRPINISIDGNKVMKATSNATDTRRK